MPVNRLLGMMALLSLLHTGCRCGAERPARPPRPSQNRPTATAAALPLAAAVSATQAEAPAVWHPLGLGDAESLLGRVQAWLGPRLGAQLAPGRHALQRTRQGVATTDVVEIGADGVTLAWPAFDLRIERGEQRAMARIGPLSVTASDDVSDRLRVLCALVALTQPQAWGGSEALRVESLGGRSDGLILLRLGIPRVRVRFVAELRADGEVVAVVLPGLSAQFSEGGKALRLETRRTPETWHWLADAPADAATVRTMLRVPADGVSSVLLMWASMLLDQPGPAGGYVEAEFDKREGAITWRALRVPVATSAGGAPRPGGTVVPVQLGEPQAVGETSTTVGGLGDAERAVAALALPDGCHVLRLFGLLGHKEERAFRVPFAVHACAR